MTPEKITELLKESLGSLGDYGSVVAQKLDPNLPLVAQGIDSLDVVEVMMELENLTGVPMDGPVFNILLSDTVAVASSRLSERLGVSLNRS